MSQLNKKIYNMKNIVCRILVGAIIVLQFFLLPLNVFANGPVAADWLSFSLSNLPIGVAFADVLIQISPEDPKYTPVNTQNLEQTGLSPESEIILFDANGFQSFTFHYKKAASSIEVYGQYNGQRIEPDKGFGYVEFCKGTEYREFYTQYEDLRKNYRTIKLAFLDKNGTIISVSEKFDLPKMNNYHVFLGHIYYDYQTGDINIGIYDNPWFILINGFFIIFFTALSVGIEAITALFFHFRREKMALVVIVNLITQALMRIAYMLLAILSFPHLLSIILLEACVYSAEYMVYRKSRVMADESTKKILIYTITSNTLSLITIAFLNGFR